MSTTELKDHVIKFRRDDFEPAIYTTKGYVLQGSIKTDGSRLQLLGFKLNELNCIKALSYWPVTSSYHFNFG